MIARNATIWIILTIGLALLSDNVAESQSSVHELRRRHPDLQQRGGIRRSSSFQNDVEQLLNYGEELRSQILETLGKLVYDHYDELNLEQLETLYRIYRNTLERKYNIFEAASSLRWQRGPLRASDICKAVNGDVCTCIKNSSQVCSSLELLDKRRSSGGGGPTDLVESIDKYSPEGLTPQALSRRLQKGDLRVTPKLLIGLLRNVRYDSFDQGVRRMEKIVTEHLETLEDSELTHESNGSGGAESVGSLLKNLLQGNAERFPAREKRAALMLADHVEPDVNSISQNIENFGTTYENKKINLKYLFELVIPEDLVDSDIVKARNHLEEEMERNNIPDKLSIAKYEHTNPAQLMLEILRQLKYLPKVISSPKNVIRALRMHADFWRKGYTIDDVSDFLKLFSAYDNLLDDPNYKDFFGLIESIKDKLTNSKNVDLELTCTMPRPCLRRVLLKILQCNMIDDDTKRTVLKFLNLINSRGTPVLEDKLAKNFKDYTSLEVPEESSETTRDQVTTTTVTPDLDIPTETKTTAGYSTKSSPKYTNKISTPRDKKSKPSTKPSTYERDMQPPKDTGNPSLDEIEKSKISVGNLKKKHPKKEIDPNDRIKKKRKPIEPPNTEEESSGKCEDGQECPSEADSTTDHPKNTKKQIKKVRKPGKPRENEEQKSSRKCEGQDCPRDLDSPTDRPKPANIQVRKKHKPKQPQTIIGPESPMKCEEGKECPQKVNSFTDQPKTRNKQVTKKLKPSKPRGTIETVPETECEEGEDCFPKLDSLTKRPKTAHKKTKKERLPGKPQNTEETESPTKCEEGQECPRNLDSPTDGPKAKNKQLKKKPKLSKPRVTEGTPVRCEEGKDCFPESLISTDNPKLPPKNTQSNDETTTPLPMTKFHRNIDNQLSKFQEKRQKLNHDRSKKPRDKPKKKITRGNENKINRIPYTDTTISSTEDTTVMQQVTDERTTLSTIESTTYDGETDTTETQKQILKDSTTISPTTPIDGFYGDIEDNITNLPTESTEISETSTNEYITTDIARSTKYPIDNLQETTEIYTEDNNDQEPFTEKYTTIETRKNTKITKKIVEETTTISPKIKLTHPKQPIEDSITDISKKSPNQKNKKYHTQTIEETTTTKPLTSDEDCDDCSSEKCKDSSSCSEEGKTSESCSNSSDGSSEECDSTSREKKAGKSCEGPNCSSPSSSSSSSVECENSSEDKCSTESTDSCANGNCLIATKSPPPTTPLPPPINGHENSTESCSDSDCSTQESCKGESCSNESNCDSNNCDAHSSNKCKGPDCSATSESCEDEDCSSNSKITDFKTTPYVEHMRLTGALCDTDDCLEKTNKDCQGPNCEPTEPTASLNCESDDCTSQTKEFCVGPNCPSRSSKTCNGIDCSQDCEGDECLNTNYNVNKPPITESPAIFKRTLSPKPQKNDNDKPKLCSTKDPNRKRKNERLQRVRQLSNSFPEEKIPSIQNNELPLDKVNVNVRRTQDRKRVQEYTRPQLGPLLKGLSKATEINKLNKNIRNQRRVLSDKSQQTSQTKSGNKQLNHSYPYPAGMHTNYNTNLGMNSNVRRQSSNLQHLGKTYNDFEKLPSRQEYMIKTRQPNNNLDDSKISKIDYQSSTRNNINEQTVGKRIDYFEYTSPPQLYQNRPHQNSKSKYIIN